MSQTVRLQKTTFSLGGTDELDTQMGADNWEEERT